MKNLLLIIGILLLVSTGQGHAQSSLLAQGDWYKIGVVEKGIYKLDRSFLTSLGINTSQIDPRHIQIFGNGGGGMLPQASNADRPVGLIENDIMVIGEEDGRFDNTDYVLFFGNSPDQFQTSVTPDDFIYHKNLYSDTVFYFIHIGETLGLRVKQSLGTPENGVTSTESWDYTIHERDLTNIISSGRYWVGEAFNNSADRTRTVNLPTPARTAGEIYLKASVVGRVPQGSSFQIAAAGSPLGTIDIQPFPDEFYGDKGRFADNIFYTSNISGGNILPITIDYQGAGNQGGHLDYLVVAYKKRLELIDKEIFFYPQIGNEATGKYEIVTSDIAAQTWDITDPTSPQLLVADHINNRLVAEIPPTTPTAIVAFRPSEAKNPISQKRVPNQNLFALSSADAVFIAPESFVQEATRLANFRMQNDGLSVHVVSTAQIYNDFSSGMQDVTAIRDFIKYQYDKSNRQLKYVLLFGDASFDYKKRTIVDHNFVPIYQSRNSTHRIFSYSSDDYYGFLEDGEGEWEESINGDHILNVGVGRLVVKSTTEAQQVVNKLIRYSTSTNRLGNWRKKIYFLADDGDFNIHLRHAEQLATYMDTVHSEYDIGKLYIDAFPQLSSGGRKVAPKATEELQKIFDDGAFIVNFTGHGNESRWTEEDLLVESMIPNFNNRVNLPLVVTATCEFGNYDNPLRFSGGEQMLLNPNGGAIALLTTTRPVFAHTNFPVNLAFYQSAFSPIDGEMPRLGDIIRLTKNNSLRGPVNRNFALLGDPTLQLAYAASSLSLVTENGGNFKIDTVSALGKYSLKGEVQLLDGTKKSDYQGTVYIEILDKPITKTTLGDESQPTTFLNWESTIFRGEATIEQGTFDVSFVVPKNISYVHGRGKVSMYAVPDNGFTDGNGAEINLIVGGSSPQLQPDTTPPTVTGYINSEEFRQGQTVGNNPLLLVRASDESGISLTTTGLGQQMTASLDGGAPAIISDFYSADKDTHQSGWIRYPLGELSEGFHTVTIIIWDTHNNMGTTTVEFYVGENEGLLLSEVMNYPNPVMDETTFSFRHNRAGEALNVHLSIISLGGKKAYERYYFFDEAEEIISEIRWNKRTDGMGIVEKGIYIYKISVQSTRDGAKNDAYQKLIIVN